jgi:hypothetical protein
MNPENTSTARSELRLFSDRPVLHYFLAMSITCIAANFFFSFRIYGCLKSGNSYDCAYDPDAPVLRGISRPDVWSALSGTLFFSAFGFLFWLLNFLILCAPVYALAHYVSRRCAVHRNVAGTAFWIGAWILAFLSAPIFIFALSGSYPSRTSWTVYLSESTMFVMVGLFCGIVYCALAFLHRERG